jgi:hypothetical protein
MSNAKVAHQYARSMRALTNKVWISDNLPMLDRKERREILAIYNKYFKTVEYDAATGICKCWIGDPVDLNDSHLVGEFDAINGHDTSTPVKDSSLKSVGIDPAVVVHAGTIITNV